MVRTCVTKGKIRGTMASSIVRAMASKHVAPAIAMFQLSSPGMRWNGIVVVVVMVFKKEKEKM